MIRYNIWSLPNVNFVRKSIPLMRRGYEKGKNIFALENALLHGSQKIIKGQITISIKSLPTTRFVLTVKRFLTQKGIRINFAHISAKVLSLGEKIMDDIVYQSDTREFTFGFIKNLVTHSVARIFIVKKEVLFLNGRSSRGKNMREIGRIFGNCVNRATLSMIENFIPFPTSQYRTYQLSKFTYI